ncbi:MAG: glycosyltransferase family 9 protein [Verrucomicrobia subdivision 3 bacterium]|nr:glycosyltransferase family 9 protein [Limisphaerales bacterium]
MTTLLNVPKRILVVRGGAIGDFVLTLPVLAALRAAHPQANVAVLGARECGELAVTGGLADESRSLEAREWAGFFVENGDCDAGARQWLAGFDWVISFLHDPEGVFELNICAASGARFLRGCHRPADGMGEPAANVLLRALEPVGISGASAVARLGLSAVDEKQNVLAVHPGSGSAAKNWPEENWAVFLSKWLTQNDADLLLVGGEAEAERLAQLSARLPRERHRVLLHAPLVEVARALSGCRAFLGHDSGITHLAAAVGLPGVVLWAETDAVVWRPPSDAMNLLQQPIATDAVLRAVTTFFK